MPRKGRELADWELMCRRWDVAYSKQQEAQREILVAALDLEKEKSNVAHPGDIYVRIDALIGWVRAYNEASAAMKAEQDALNERARNRPG